MFELRKNLNYSEKMQLDDWREPLGSLLIVALQMSVGLALVKVCGALR